MRIAMLSYHSSPVAPLGGKHTGGMNVYVRELSLRLAEFGHQVDIFTRGAQAAELDLYRANRGAARLIALPAGPSRTLERDELVEHIPAFAELLLDHAAKQGLNYDLIHAHYWMSGLVAARLKAEWRVPMLLMFHTLGLVKNRIEALGERESDERIRGERQAIAAADMVVAATPAEQADLQWLYEVRSPRITVIPPGVDHERFQKLPAAEARARLGLPRDRAILLYVGRIEPLKGIDTLIRAVQRLPGPVRPEVYVIGGEANVPDEQLDSEMARLQALASELGLAEQVHFLGKREQDELPAFYSAADIVVLPSYYESFGMVALEAMTCGVPVIASRVGGLAYLVEDGISGYHVPEGSSEELAERLDELLADSALRERLGQGGQQVARAYGWDTIAARVANLYKIVLETGASKEN